MAKPGKESGLLLDRLFFCPSCTTWRTSTSAFRSQTKLRTLPRTKKRHASTLSSTTAINATKNVPSEYQPLYRALNEVRSKASAHVNISRLQLALQGLESKAPTIRVAVLGVDVHENARRLVRLLLADPLEDEERWEKELLSNISNYSNGVLIRYGQRTHHNLPQASNSIPIIQVPASILERNNIEILVSSVHSLNIGEELQSTQTNPADSFLSPTLGTPTSANGRQTIISQPVHSCIVLGEGLDGLASIVELLASTNFLSREDRRSVRTVIDLHDLTLKEESRISPVDLIRAEEGLAAIRNSLGQATTYEHKWNESGMPSLIQWVALAAATQSSGLRTPIQNLISSLLTIASRNIEDQAALASRSAQSQSLSLPTQTSLELSVEEFSRQAHNELQAGLASAWSSRNWRKLAWFKLFWRVDDVGLIITDLLTNAWLPKTERAVYEMSGRFSQVGITPIQMPASETQSEVSDVKDTALPIEKKSQGIPIPLVQLTSANDAVLEPVIVNKSGNAQVEMRPIPRPKPLAIAISDFRNVQLQNTIAELTSTAQQLVFRTLSITGLSAGLSGLTYLSLTPGSFYEAGTIAALGTAYALRTMQGGWQRATKAMEENLFQEGRNVITRLVENMRTLVQRRSSVQEDEIELHNRQQAKQSVEQAKEELRKLS